MQDNNQSSDLNNENSEAKTTSNLFADNKSSEATNSNSKIDASKIYPDAKLLELWIITPRSLGIRIS